MKRSVMVFILLFLFFYVEAQDHDEFSSTLQSKMIWSGPDDGKPGYTVFRKTFELVDLKEATIHIFADARYFLWVNGIEILRGPCRFDPVSPAYDSKEITSFLKQGKNAVVVMVMSHGSTGKTMNHKPGLTAGIEITNENGGTHTLWSDNSWKYTTQTRYLPPVQMWGEICDRIDARLDDGAWEQTEYDDAKWNTAVPVNGNDWGLLLPRAISLLAEKEMDWVPMNKSRLPVGLKAGQSYIIKANEMIQGFPVIQFDAEAEGITVQFELGYTADSLNIGNTYGLACVYITRKGEQTFVPTDSYGFRYLKISVLNGSIYSPHNILIKQIKLIDRRFPYVEEGSFICNDSFLNDLFQRSVLTAKLNCEDGYTDCALREKVEWMGDAALIQYPLSRRIFAIPDSNGVLRSDHQLMASMLRHIAQSQGDSGLFKAHHPNDNMDIHGYIEDYCCLWVQALREIYEYSGNSDLVRELWIPLKKQMKWFGEHTTSNGLVSGREFTFFDNPLAYCHCEGATLNAYVFKAYCDAAFLAEKIGDSQAEKEYKKRAAELYKNYNARLWIPTKQSYSSGLFQGKQMVPTAHAALMALSRGIVPEGRQEKVKKYLFAHYADRGQYSQEGHIPDSFFDLDIKTDGIGFPYTSFWLLDEMFNDGRDTEALSYIRNKWAKMMKDTIAGTLWEAFGGGDICHNLGAIPAWFLSSKVLGVSVKLPVESRILSIKPQLGDLSGAEGTVVTEFGPVHVKWVKQGKTLSFTIDIPEKTQAEIILPYEESAKKIISGNKEVTVKRVNNNIIFKINSDVSDGEYK